MNDSAPRLPGQDGPTAPPSTPVDERPVVYPPLAVWKLALLLLLTLSLYSVFWMFRTARDLELGGRGQRNAWLWFLAPLIAIVYGGATYKMAEAVREWEDDANSAPSTPLFPGLLGMIAFAGSAVFGAGLRFGMPLWAATLALTTAIAPLLVMQGQLNCIKTGERFRFRSPAWRFSWPQRVAIGVIGIVWALNTWLVSKYWLAERNGTPLAAGDVIQGGGGNFELRAPTDGWVQIEPGLHNEAADIELLLAGTDDWAAVYYRPGASLDNVAESHTRWVREWYSDEANCAETRTMDENTSHVTGRISCSGVSFADGEFVVLSHAISDGRRTVELVVEISDPVKRVFADRRAFTNLSGGLELK